MRQNKTLEITVGLFIAGGLAALLVLAMKVSNLTQLNQGDGYNVVARFENIGGLKVRSPVKVGGVRIGRVAGIDYDTERYQAVVTMQLEGKYNQFPDDTSASVYTAGLLGEQYIALEPGGAEDYLQQGSEIDITQSAVIIEQLISKFLFNKASEPSGE
ncbi:MAG: outer membrane lipid asymmetry maintenance protein MlaD [Gammaproteobacteria bacterium]